MKIAVGFHNGIGNFVIFTSILRSLAYFSKQPVDLIISEDWQTETSEAVIQIAEKLSSVRTIIPFPSKYNSKKYAYKFMSYHSTYEDSFFAHLKGEDRINPERYTAWAESFLHERDFYFLEMIRDINYRGKVFSQEMPSIPFSKGKKKKPIRICISNGRQVMSNGIWDRKQYPFFYQVIMELMAFYDAEIYLLGGETDVQWTEEILESVRSEDCISVAGKLSILETAGLIKSSDLVISVDTSVFHIADALEVPGIALFGPTLVSKNGPLNKTVIPIRTPLLCGPCQGTSLMNFCSDPQCMASISPNLVLATARTLLSKRK